MPNVRGCIVTVRVHDELGLVAARSAISCSRVFAEYTLDKWHAPAQLIDDALQVVDALVTSAVRSTGMMDEHPRWTEITSVNFITVRLLGLKSSLRIEVWDSSPDPPVFPHTGVSMKRGFSPASPGKVVWAELPVLPYRRGTVQVEQPIVAPAEQFGQT